VTVQQEILDLFRDLQAEFGMAMLFVTHDLAVAADICDRISVMYAGEMVEMAEVGQLFARPLHPYTRGLLSAMPHASNRQPPLPTIRGNVPRPGSWPAGCRFSSRCDYGNAACDVRVPLLGDQRLVRCIRAEELALEAAR
jgi:peptide/nickel transport system permease protein